MSDTVKYVLEFPRAGVDGLWSDEGQATAEMKEAAVLELFRQKRISVRRGAELLGLTYRGFLDLASRHQISLFEYEEGELEDEVEALRSLTSPAP